MSKYCSFWLEVALILVLPIILFSINPSFFALRHVVMGLGGLYCSYRLFRAKATLSSLGIRQTNFLHAVKDLALPSFIFVGISLLIFFLLPIHYLKIIVGYDPLIVQSFTRRITAYIFLSTPIQELIFRGYVTWRIQKVYQSPRLIQLLSVTIFVFVHLPFFSPLLLLITLFMGLTYFTNYQKYQNIFAPILSHAFVGACILIIRNAWFPYV
ncbi:MAG: CPBP family glutamic-type intramembrane protease [bacterium]